MKFSRSHLLILALGFIIFCASCNQKKTTALPGHISATQMDRFVQDSIADFLTSATQNKGFINAGLSLYAPLLLQYYYDLYEFAPVWSSNKQWKPAKDSLMQYLRVCEQDGLFPQSYHLDTLQALTTKLDLDSNKLQSPGTWAKADLLLTDALVHMLEDLKHGRLHADSLSWKHNAGRHETFFRKYLDTIQAGASISSVAQMLQPGLMQYQELRKAVPSFLDSMNRKKYIYLVYPFKDSSAFYKNFLARLAEEGISEKFPARYDSAAFKKMVNSYQAFRGLQVNGKLTAALVQRLNDTDLERFKRIAITLDRYKQLVLPMPRNYIWVNLPSYYLQVREADSIAIESKVVIGKPNTPTPLINSFISDLVIYPTWTVPNSIIVKEILPGLKRDPGYLARKGLSLFDYNGNYVDPFSVNWARYTKGIPYLVRQSSGDDNALGIMKFNFKNPFSVYLHDTNQRYLFKNKKRSLSHGCVRVQDWKKLAFYIVKNDSMLSKQPDSLKLTTDSISSWIALKQNLVVGIGNRLPLYIGYYTCEPKNRKIMFYEDVYNKDKAAREKYTAFK